jgi:hypothetical protein
VAGDWVAFCETWGVLDETVDDSELVSSASRSMNVRMGTYGDESE